MLPKRIPLFLNAAPSVWPSQVARRVRHCWGHRWADLRNAKLGDAQMNRVRLPRANMQSTLFSEDFNVSAATGGPESAEMPGALGSGEPPQCLPPASWSME